MILKPTEPTCQCLRFKNIKVILLYFLVAPQLAVCGERGLCVGLGRSPK